MPLLNTIVNTLLPAFAFDPVAIFTQDFVQVFASARPLKAVVKEEAKVMEHPIETGGTIVDHRIVLPVEIDLSLVINANDYQDTYAQIKEYYLNSTLLVVQTRSGVYQNQIISSMPHEEDPSQYDVLSVALSFKQIQFVTAKFAASPRNASNKKTVDRGVQQGKVKTPSVLSGIFKIGEVAQS